MARKKHDVSRFLKKFCFCGKHLCGAEMREGWRQGSGKSSFGKKAAGLPRMVRMEVTAPGCKKSAQVCPRWCKVIRIIIRKLPAENLQFAMLSRSPVTMMLHGHRCQVSTHLLDSRHIQSGKVTEQCLYLLAPCLAPTS